MINLRANERARHVKYTIPPAIILSLLYRPLCTRLDLYKIAFLITVREKAEQSTLEQAPLMRVRSLLLQPFRGIRT
jgi:hypothetical protein